MKKTIIVRGVTYWRSSRELASAEKKQTQRAAPPAVDQDFRRDRLGHNGKGDDPHLSRLTYLASAKGYVMARRPGCTPFAISEALWRSFPYWTPASGGREQRRTKTHTGAPVHPSAGKPPGYPDDGAGDKARA